MKKHFIYFFLIAVLLFASGCGKKEKPNEKFIGTYKVTDDWKSSRTEIGSGSLKYDLIIVPDGEDGLLLMNVNKTLNSVKAKVTDDIFTIPYQTSVSSTGKTYNVNGFTGKIVGDKLELKFAFNEDALYSGIGNVDCNINGTKEKKEDK